MNDSPKRRKVPLLAYQQVLDLVDDAPALVREARRRRGMTYRDLSAQVDLSHSTISHFEDGEESSFSTFRTLLAWLVEDAEFSRLIEQRRLQGVAS